MAGPASISGYTAFSALMAPDIWRVYEMVGKERPTEYDKVMGVEDLPWNPVKMQQVAGVGPIPSKPEGQTFVLDAPVQEGSMSVICPPYGMAVEFTFEAWEDEQYGVFKDMAKELSRSGRNREELVAWGPWNGAFATPAIASFDGLSLCNTAHTSSALAGLTQANRPNPDQGLSVSALQGSILRYHNMVNDRNMPQVMFPSTLIISPTNLFAAQEILGSTNKPFTADNEINSLVSQGLQVMVSHYLTTATNWFLVASKEEHDVKFGWRTHPILDSFDDPWTKNAVVTIYFRIVAWNGDWRGVDGSTG